MWGSAPLIPALLSPDWTPSIWGLCLAALVLVSASPRRAYTGSLVRGFGILVILQSLSFALALAAGEWLRHARANPIDAYVVGAAVNGLLYLVALGRLWMGARRGPAVALMPQGPIHSPARSDAATKLVAMISLIAVVVSIGPLLVYFVLLLSYAGRWPPGTLGCILMFAAVALALMVLRAAGKGRPPAPRAAKVLSGLLVVISLGAWPFQRRFPVAPVRVMTDGALASGIWDGRRLSDAMLVELNRRPASHWSGLAHVVRRIRLELADGPSGLPFRTILREHSGAGEASLHTRALELLQVLVRRGRMDEAMAWIDDDALPVALRLQVVPILAEAEGRHTGCMAADVTAKVGSWCPYLREGCSRAFEAAAYGGGTCGPETTEQRVFAAVYASLRMQGLERVRPNPTSALLSRSASPERSESGEGLAAALGVATAAKKDPAHVHSWVRQTLSDPSNCSAVQHLAHQLCPSVVIPSCSAHEHQLGASVERDVQLARWSTQLMSCMTESSPAVPERFARLAQY